MPTLFCPRVLTAAVALVVMSVAHAAPTLWIDDSSGRLGTVDVGTGAVAVIGTMSAVMTDIAFDPTGQLYGISFGSLYRIDPATAASTLIGNLGASLNSLVFGSNGTLYAANNRLFTVNTTTGAATAVGNGGSAYSSSGDLAFAGGSLYLTSGAPSFDTLFRLDTATGAGSIVGAMGVGAVYGLATNDNVALYGVAGTGVYGVNTATGAANLLLNYGGKGLGSANGTAFFAEAAPPVPEPETYALMGVGLGVLGWLSRRRQSQSRG